MLKNLIISILTVVLLFQTEVYTEYRSVLLFVSMAAVAFVSITMLECQWMEYKRQKKQQRRFKRQVNELTRKGAV